MAPTDTKRGTEGQDWAGYQTTQPSTTGLGFVFVKATEGTGYVNPKHAAQVATGRAHGLVVGHYHFQRPGSPTAQADYFLAHAAAKAGDVLACDWEDTGVPDDDKDAFIKAVQKAQPHLRVILYCNRDFWLHRDSTSFCGDGLWIADPSAPKGQPRIKDDWLFHQYGSPGDLDRNFTPLSAAQLRAWATGTTTNTPSKEIRMATALTTDHIPTIALATQGYRNADADAASVAAGSGHIPDSYAMLTRIYADTIAAAAGADPGTAVITDGQAVALGEQLATSASFVDTLSTAIADKIAARLQA